MGEIRLSRKEFAAIFDVTIRQVDNWVVEGLPRIEVGRNRFAYGVESIRFVVRKIKERENGGPKSPRFQREVLRVEHEKLELLRKQRELIPIALHRERLAVIVERIAATFKSMPARFARRLVGAKKIAEARVVLESLREELIDELLRIPDDDD
jgi:phage terminase Nu1 subunit (DNA packaging protein)